ncbi:GLUCOSYL/GLUCURONOSYL TRANSFERASES [Salix purpurea]|uniref:GLUCOSYL/GLUCURONOSYL TRANSFERASES n=1 Tax=Salix purpurea TaxID=77065 RepID=A0A9Q0PQF0_SALPP|nr:GLUCOSYL/GLUCURONOSYL TRANSFERASES [Salix purpurea]
METFEELEPELIQHMSEIFPIKAVGPLLRNPKVPKTTVQGDFRKADDCIEWLDTKPPSSVVYVSFGSVVELKQDQWNEIAHGLLNSGVSFLLVMKTPCTPERCRTISPPCSARWVLGESRKQGQSGAMESSREGFSSPIGCMLRNTLWVELFHGSTHIRHASGGFSSMG